MNAISNISGSSEADDLADAFMYAALRCLGDGRERQWARIRRGGVIASKNSPSVSGCPFWSLRVLTRSCGRV